MSDAMIGVAQLVDNIMEGHERLDRRATQLKQRHLATDMARDVGDLRSENAELRLYLATVISLLISNNLVTREEFEKISTLLDGMDGVVDGRFDGQIGTDGTVGVSADNKNSQNLRELSQVLKNMGR